MDFTHDLLENVKSVRMLNVMDDFNCEVLGTEIYFSLPSEPTIRALKQIMAWQTTDYSVR